MASRGAGPEIYDPGQRDQTIGNQIVVLLMASSRRVQRDSQRQPGWPQGEQRRPVPLDGQGRTWSERIFVDQLGTIFITDLDTGDDVRTVTSS